MGSEFSFFPWAAISAFKWILFSKARSDSWPNGLGRMSFRFAHFPSETAPRIGGFKYRMYTKLYMRFLLLGSKEYPVGASQGIDPHPSGGYEKYTARLCEALIAEGHEVSLITRRFKNQPKEEHVGFLSVYRVPYVPGFFIRTPSFSFFTLLKALRLPFDAIVTSGVLSGGVGFFLHALFRKPWICRPGGLAFGQPQYPRMVSIVLKFFEAFIYGHAPMVIFLSAQEKDSFRQKMGFLPKRFRIIPTGVDVPKKFPKKTRQTAVVFVGRFLPVKGIRYLIDDMKGVPAALWLVGDGPGLSEAKVQAKKNGLKNVHFFGYRKKVEPFLLSARVFCLPSVSEGLPLALLEAYAHRIPCVVTDIGLPAENGKTALVVPPKDPIALRAAILRLLKDPTLSSRISRNAYALAQSFTWKKTAQAYQEVTLACAV